MNQLSTSKTLMVHKNAIDGRPEQPGLPMMLKVPDASFSCGGIKVKDLGHLKRGVRQLFRDTDLVLVQRAVCMMGDGLYGVDIKQTTQGLKVIEVNDNPSIDAGVEDRVHGYALYQRVMAESAQCLEGAGCKATFVRVWLVAGQVRRRAANSHVTEFH